MTEHWIEVAGYRLDAARYYDAKSHLWAEPRAGIGLARIGFDPLGRETTGDVVEVSFVDAGTRVRRGDAFGSIEAAKYVGPLEAPVSGVVGAGNQEVLDRPGLLNEDPNEAGWLVGVQLADSSELSQLLTGEDQLRPWFAAEVERYRRQGAVAE